MKLLYSTRQQTSTSTYTDDINKQRQQQITATGAAAAAAAVLTCKLYTQKSLDWQEFLREQNLNTEMMMMIMITKRV